MRYPPDEHAPVAVVAGAIVPHAPVLALPTLPPRLRSSSEAIQSAVESLTLDGCEMLVMVSPHGHGSGVYSAATGSLDGFGVRGRSMTATTDLVVAEELADRWGRPLLEPPVDHGITSPLLRPGWTGGRPLIPATLAGTTGPGAPGGVAEVIEDAVRLADAVSAISNGLRIGFVASAHTSAALSPSAPLLDRPEGHALEERVLTALGHDVADFAGIEPESWRVAGACGAGPLSAFARLFAGRRAHLLAYETPAGVGYLVAQAGV